MTKQNISYHSMRWTGASTILRSATYFIQLFILARLLTPADFGLMALALSVIATLTVLSDFGLSQAIIRFQETNANIISTLFWLNLFISLIFSLLTISTASFIADFYGDERLFSILCMLAAAFPITSITQITRAIAEKAFIFRRLAVAEISAVVISVSCTIIIANNTNYGVYSMVFGYMILSVLGAIFSITIVLPGWRPRLVFNVRESLPHIQFGLSVAGASLANTLGAQADVIVAGRLFPASAVGLFTQPRELSFRIMMVLNPIITRVTLPLISRFSADRHRIGAIYIDVTSMVASINFPIYCFIACFATDIVPIVLGKQWILSTELLRAIAVWSLFRCIGNPIGSLLVGTGYANRALLSSIAVTICVFVISFICGSQFGLLAIPYSLAALYAVFVFLFYIFNIRPVCELPAGDYFLCLLRPLIASLFASAISYSAVSLYKSDGMKLAAGTLLFGMAYLCSSYVVNRQWLVAFFELLGLARSEKRKQIDDN